MAPHWRSWNSAMSLCKVLTTLRKILQSKLVESANIALLTYFWKNRIFKQFNKKTVQAMRRHGWNWFKINGYKIIYFCLYCWDNFFGLLFKILFSFNYCIGKEIITYYNWFAWSKCNSQLWDSITYPPLPGNSFLEKQWFWGTQPNTGMGYHTFVLQLLS